MKINTWLSKATSKLNDAGVPSARLDALILLEDSLKKDRAYVLAHDDGEIPADLLNGLDQRLEHRKAREPLAYIRGHIEFYGRSFEVSKDVLIPRPESESIIEEALKLDLPARPTVADVGTGSGALAITLALELPSASVSAYDNSEAALKVAKRSAQELSASVNFAVSDLLSAASTSFDLIVANLPYVAEDQDISPETVHEPAQALYAANDGLSVITALLVGLNEKQLNNDGYLILEAEPRQHQSIVTLANKQGLNLLKTNGFIQVFGSSAR